MVLCGDSESWEKKGRASTDLLVISCHLPIAFRGSLTLETSEQEAARDTRSKFPVVRQQRTRQLRWRGDRKIVVPAPEKSVATG
jgi:hypothetical protein